LYIQVTDDDGSSGTQRVADIYVYQTLDPGSISDRTNYSSSIHDTIQIELSFQIHCDDNFYDRNCSEPCMHTDDTSGHYACGPNGEQVCLSGWSDPGGNCLTRKCTRVVAYLRLYTVLQETQPKSCCFFLLFLCVCVCVNMQLSVPATAVELVDFAITLESVCKFLSVKKTYKQTKTYS